MGKVWKTGGEEDKFIEKLIRKKKINKFTKPITLKSYPAAFGEFNANVVRNHLNLLKRSNGLYRKLYNIFHIFSGVIILFYLVEGGETDDENDEDDGKCDAPVANVEGDHTAIYSEPMISGFSHITQRNYPIVCEVYKDPENQCEKVALVIDMPGGAQKVTIQISDDGATATIKYQWCKTMIDMPDLFRKMLAFRDIHHPRILCIKNGLEKYRQRIDAAPEAMMTICLPIRVQTSSDSWSHVGVKRDDGTQILMADITGYVKNYNTKLINTVVQFD